jgi:hypothetical protein
MEETGGDGRYRVCAAELSQSQYVTLEQFALRVRERYDIDVRNAVYLAYAGEVHTRFPTGLRISITRRRTSDQGTFFSIRNDGCDRRARWISQAQIPGTLIGGAGAGQCKNPIVWGNPSS